MGKVVDKQAFFSVRFAQNILKLPPQQRQQALKQMPTKGVALIQKTIEMIEARKKGASI